MRGALAPVRVPREVGLMKATYIRIAAAVVLVACVAVAGHVATTRIAVYQREQYFEARKFQAATAAASLEPSDVAALRGVAEDEESPAFKSVRAQLQRIKNSDVRMRFIYLMRPLGGRMVFLADAEGSESHAYSPPGSEYREAEPSEFAPFEGRAAPDPWVMGPAKDRWGTWISASAYVLGDDGKPTAVLGTDVAVEKALASFNQTKKVGIIYNGLVCALLALLLAQWIVSRHVRERRETGLAREQAP